MKKIILISIIIIVLVIVGYTQCPKEGRNKKGNSLKTELQQLNLLKNRNTQPKSSEIDKKITLEKIMNSKDDPNAFKTSSGVIIEGYIFKAKDEGGESCNCYSNDPKDLDVHVYISNNKYIKSIAECTVIEVSKYSKQLHPEWCANYFNTHYKGHKVQVTGWMMYDFEHKNVSNETNPNSSKCHRKTVWEVHPITSVKIID